jgi:hypothetical protein
MKKNIIICGLISGFISIIGFLVMPSDMENMDKGMIYGYASMLLAFSLIFVGIKNFRDKYNNGTVTFGRAFMIGLYVATWLIDYYFFIPDFMDRYAAYTIEKMKAAGTSKAELDKYIAKMEDYKEMYKNPLFVILFTYMEILWVGVLVSLIAAGILRKKPVMDNPQIL